MKKNLLLALCVLSVLSSLAQSEEKADVLSKKASSFFESSNWDSAEYYYRAAALAYDQLGNRRKYFQESNQIIEIYLMENRLFEMKTSIDSLLSQVSEQDSSLLEVRSYLLSNLSIYYERIFLLKKSLYYAELAIELLERAPKNEQNNLNLASFYLNIGLLYQRNRDYLQALKYYRQSLILREEYGAEPMGMADIHNSIAVANFYLGQYDEALKQYQLSLDYYYKALDPIHPKVAIAFNNMAFSHMRLQHYDSSLFYHRKALNIRQKTLNENHPETVSSFNGMGLTYTLSKDFDSAEFYLNTALKRLEISDSPNFDYFKSRVYYNLSRLYNDQDSIKKSLKALNKALAFHLPNEGLQDSTYTKILNIPDVLDFMSFELALRSRLYKQEPSVSDLNECLELFDQIQSLSNFYLNDIKFIDSQLSVVNILEDAYPIGIDLIYDRYLLSEEGQEKEKLVDQLFQSVEYFKANLLKRNIFKTRQIKLSRLDDALIEREEELRAEIAVLKSNQQDSLLLFEKEQQYSKVMKEIETSDPQFHELRFQKLVPSLDEAKEFSKTDNKIILEYFLSDHALYAMLIENEKVEVSRVDIDSTFSLALNDLFGRLSNNSSLYADKSDRQLALFETVLGDFFDKIQGKDVVIVADGILNQIPFEVFMASQGQYLLESTTISYANSLALLLKSYPQRASDGVKVLAFAPDYDIKNSNDEMIRGDGLVQLQWAEKEVSAIDDSYVIAPFIGTQATEEAFKNNIQDYDIVHFAGHGIVDDSDPMRSRLAFSSPNDSSYSPYLFVQELLGMNVSADLVVLSACKSGAGRIINGEGTLSLARGFFYAGSKSVVMSLWSVDDQSTSVIMSSFYKNLSKGLTKSEALRQAKLEFLETAPPEKHHPFYWGAFVVIGDDSPLFMRSYLWVLPVVLVVFLLVLVVTGHLKRSAGIS
ncbi:MAG: CHAT domain-containing tetratricopeptide repeat protein [Bacteroidota bacterium]